MLSFTDIVVLCMPLAAAVLAVMKDTFKKEEPGGKKKLTPFGVAALILAAIGFGLSWYVTDQAKQVATRKDDIEKEFKGYVKKALDQELPVAITSALKNTQTELNNSFSKTVDAQKAKLERAIDKATDKSSSEVRSAIQSSGNAVTADINKSQKGIETTLGITESKINGTIHNVETVISGVVQHADENIQASVKQAVDASANKVAGVISEAGEEQTKRIRETAEQAIGEQVMQIPLTIYQGRKGRLTGLLSDIVIDVGDVSKDKPFTFKVSDQNGTVLYNQNIDPTKGWSQTIPFRHPRGEPYLLEVTIQVQHNTFGTGPDYVVIRAINAVTAARK